MPIRNSLIVGDAKITLIGVQDKPGVAADIFEPLSNNQVNVDMVIQNISSDHKQTDITFTIKRNDLLKTLELLKNNKEMNEAFGKETINSYIKLRKSEINEFDNNENFDKSKPVTQWERQNTLDC